MLYYSYKLTSLYGVGRTLEALPISPCNRGARAMDTLEPTIEYRPIPNFPGYRVGSDGSVWSCTNSRHGLLTTWRRMSLKPNQGGYYAVPLWHNNTRKVRRVHMLVLECFVGPRPPGMFGLHKNDQSLDNRLENLYWGTHQDNIQDAIRNKRLRVGKAHPHCTISEEVVHLIRHRATQGESHSRIAADLQIGRRTVSKIITGTNRRYVTAIVGEETRLAEEQAARVIIRKQRARRRRKLRKDGAP